MFRTSFLNLNGVRVRTRDENLFIVDNLGVAGSCRVEEIGEIISNYFEKIISPRGAERTEEFLREKGRIALTGGVILNTEGVIIRNKEGF